MKKYLAIIVLSSIFVMACSTNYIVTYDTYLEESVTKELRYSDELFDFSFIPVQNGIWFTIKNKTNKMGYLDWDESYFIVPSGNSFKALDMDAINTVEEVSKKSTNQALIPAKAIYERFTTPNINMKKFVESDHITFRNIFSNFNITLSNYTHYFEAGSYWVTSFSSGQGWNDPYMQNNKSEGSILDRYCELIKNDLIMNNKLGLGLNIIHEDTIYDYHFDFRVKQVNIYEVKRDSKKLVRTLSEHNNYMFIEE